MSFGFGVSDILGATKLAWDLYHKCWVVAQEAPEEFRLLVNELHSLQGVLQGLRDDFSSDQALLERMGEDRLRSLKHCLAGSMDTLLKLQKLVGKYQILGFNDGNTFWKKIQWIAERPKINDLKAKIMVHHCNLNLYMSSIGNASLSRIESSLQRALERQPQIDLEADEIEDISIPSRRDTLASSHPFVKAQKNGDVIDSLSRRLTDRTLVPGSHAMVRGTSASSESTQTSEDHGDNALRASTSAPLPQGRFDTPVKKARQFSLNSARGRERSPSPMAYQRDSQQSLSKQKEITTIYEPSLDIDKAVGEAMGKLLEVRQRDQVSRPLRVVTQSSEHTPSDILKISFQESIDHETRMRTLNVREWLRVGTWWLLKARHSLSVAAPNRTRSNTVESLSPSRDSSSSHQQAYIDLLKASYIIYDIVLASKEFKSLLVDENRKLFYNVCYGLQETFEQFDSSDAPDAAALSRLNSSIWENQQPEEELHEQNNMPTPGRDRWCTVEQEDAGREDEHVLFRTFVNAEIGNKSLRLKTREAPYMLLLFTTLGESEPKVAVCNQSGSMFLQRDFTPDDILDTLPFAPQAFGSSIGNLENLSLGFEHMKIVVSFANDRDMQAFMDIPRTYFNAVRQREPRELRHCTEHLIFRAPIEIFEQLHPSTMKSVAPPRKAWSCDLRILETTYSEGWRARRRLAISSSAKELNPWYQEFFLPLTHVQLSNETGGRQVLVKWADTTKELITTDGAYNSLYSYIWDPHDPNIAFSLHFRGRDDAARFEKTLLEVSLKPNLSWSGGSNRYLIYDVFDAEPNSRHYKAILIVHERMGWKWSEVCYTQPDSEVALDPTRRRIVSDQLFYAHYVSNYIKEPRRSTATPPAHYDKCNKRPMADKGFEYGDERDGYSIMGALTREYQLVYACRAVWVTLKASSLFSSSRSKGRSSAMVYLWRRTGSSISSGDFMLSFRWESRHADRWVSLPLRRSTIDRLSSVYGSDRVNLPICEFERGSRLDFGTLKAWTPPVKGKHTRGGVEAGGSGPITIAFETVGDRENFDNVLRGRDSTVSASTS